MKVVNYGTYSQAGLMLLLGRCHLCEQRRAAMDAEVYAYGRKNHRLFLLRR